MGSFRWSADHSGSVPLPGILHIDCRIDTADLLDPNLSLRHTKNHQAVPGGIRGVLGCGYGLAATHCTVRSVIREPVEVLPAGPEVLVEVDLHRPVVLGADLRRVNAPRWTTVSKSSSAATVTCSGAPSVEWTSGSIRVQRMTPVVDGSPLATDCEFENQPQ